MKDRIRILFASNIKTMSGAELVLLDFLVAARDEVDALVLAPKGELLDETRRRGIPSRRSYGLRELERSHSWWWPLESIVVWPVAVFEVAYHAFATQRHLVHANNLAAGIYAVPAARGMRKRAVWTIHDLLRKGSLESRLLRRLSRLAHRLITVSSAVAEDSIAHGVSPSKVSVIHNSVDATRFTPDQPIPSAFRDQHDIPKDAIVIATLGQITPGKGIDLILHVAREVAALVPLRFVIAGSAPPALRRFEEGVRSRVLDDDVLSERALLVGRLDDPVALLASSDLFLHGAIYPEAFSLATLEAMAMGLPVVVPRAGGLMEIVTPAAGLLYEPGDAEGARRHIQRLIDDPQQRIDLGRRARERALAFSPRHQERALLRVYEEVLR